ncbi:MAG: lysine biosynthesis protein LysW [Candidatus Micrarchaeota archaeon]|nr:lysine biosynthesis protein LysW [Candidatus Micrarchaeota archaeon]
MAISECPACTYHIALPPGLKEGEAMVCPDCGARIKLAKIYPPVFELVEEVE